MADKKTENLTSASALGGTEIVHIVQGGNSRKTPISAFRSYILPAWDTTPPSDDENKVLSIDGNGNLIWFLPTYLMTGAQIDSTLTTYLSTSHWFVPDFDNVADVSKVLTIKTDGSGTEWLTPSGGGGGGISDAPSDGKTYGRKDAAWIELPPKYQPITTYTANQTAVIGNENAYVRMNVATANTYTIPPNSTVAFAVGSIITVRQAGAGQTTLVAGSGVTLNTAETLKLRKTGSTVSLIKIDTDIWDVTGDLELV